MNETLENSHGNHHTILLLSDGVILCFGGGADEAIVNEDIIVDSTQNIEKVAFAGLGAVTHGFDQNQRYVPAANFIANPIQNKLVVPAPANSAVAPPGYYMLFVLKRSINSANGDSQLVPSLAKYVRITE